MYTSKIYVLNFLSEFCLAYKCISEERKCKLKLKLVVGAFYECELGHLMLRDLLNILTCSSVILLCLETQETF